jgi:hypothetical protein
MSISESFRASFSAGGNGVKPARGAVFAPDTATKKGRPEAA